MSLVEVNGEAVNLFTLNDAFETILNANPELYEVVQFCKTEIAGIEEDCEDRINIITGRVEGDAMYATQEHYENVLHDIQDEAEAALNDFETMKRPPQGARKMHDRLQSIVSHCLANT